MKLKHYASKCLALSTVAFLISSLFADNFYNEEITISTRNGTSNIGGSIDLTSSFGSTTTLGFGYSHSNSDRSLNLYSSYNAPSLLEQVRLGVHGIDHVKMDPALALHKFSSAAILQMTAPRDRMDAVLVAGRVLKGLSDVYKASQIGASTMVQGSIVLGKVANDVVEKGQQKAKEMQSGAKSTTGGQLPDPDDGDKEKDAKSALKQQKLREDLAKEQQLKEEGIITHRGGNDSSRSDYFRDAEKFAKEYGGKTEEWVKKTSSSFELNATTKIETHWTENLTTGQRLATKVKEIIIEAVKNA